MTEASTREQHGRILIVDDNATCIDVLRRILHKEFNVETARDGGECLAKLPLFKPHLVLLDIMMPGMDGYETCRRIKFGPLGDFVQVMLVSCKDLIVDRVRGYDSMADDYRRQALRPRRIAFQGAGTLLHEGRAD